MADGRTKKIAGAYALLAGLIWSGSASAACETSCTATLDAIQITPELDCMGVAFEHSERDECGCDLGVTVTNNCPMALERSGDIMCAYDDCTPMLSTESYYMWFGHDHTSRSYEWSFTVTESDSGDVHDVRVTADVELFPEASGCSVESSGKAPLGGGAVLLGAFGLLLARRSQGAGK
jgi:MYXO-CTERM domain-containing protein